MSVRLEVCEVCGTRLTGEMEQYWGEVCSEVCWDSLDAEVHERVDKILADES